MHSARVLNHCVEHHALQLQHTVYSKPLASLTHCKEADSVLRTVLILSQNLMQAELFAILGPLLSLATNHPMVVLHAVGDAINVT